MLSEIQIVEKRITHPELFFSYSDNKSTSSHLHWNGTQTELKELITALYLDGVITTEGNAKASFIEIVKTFEQIFNISIGESKYIKRDILRRKTKLTVFLDKLRSRLINNEF